MSSITFSDPINHIPTSHVAYCFILVTLSLFDVTIEICGKSIILLYLLLLFLFTDTSLANHTSAYSHLYTRLSKQTLIE